MVAEADIRQHMQVIGSDGVLVGVVDRVDGGRTKLTKNHAVDGRHHFIERGLVNRVGERVYLFRPRRPGDRGMDRRS